MKSIFSITFGALIASVAAQSGSFMGFSLPPACATNCITDPVKAAGCGTIPNLTCVCKAPGVVAALKTCIPSKCKGSELTSFEGTINSACKGVVGYPVKLGA